jgi:hypothetical protein
MPPNFRTISASSEALRLDVMATVIPRKDMKQSCNLWIIKTWAYAWKVQFNNNSIKYIYKIWLSAKSMQAWIALGTRCMDFSLHTLYLGLVARQMPCTFWTN